MRMSSPKLEPEASSPGAELWDDERLLAGLYRGERAAAGQLYDLLRGPIDRALRRVLHQRGPDFEDLVQLTFERLLRSLSEGRFEGRSSLKTFASAIASHVALDALRRKQRERLRTGQLPDDEVLSSTTHTDKRLESLTELRRVQAILLDMKPDLAETLIMHDVLGHKVSEIGELRGTSESAAQSRLFRARIELKRRALRSLSGGKS